MPVRSTRPFPPASRASSSTPCGCSARWAGTTSAMVCALMIATAAGRRAPARLTPFVTGCGSEERERPKAAAEEHEWRSVRSSEQYRIGFACDRFAPKVADPQPRPVCRKQTIVQGSLEQLRGPIGEASQFGLWPAVGGVEQRDRPGRTVMVGQHQASCMRPPLQDRVAADRAFDGCEGIGRLNGQPRRR